jgi:hypothetical protein
MGRVWAIVVGLGVVLGILGVGYALGQGSGETSGGTQSATTVFSTTSSGVPLDVITTLAAPSTTSLIPITTAPTTQAVAGPTVAASTTTAPPRAVWLSDLEPVEYEWDHKTGVRADLNGERYPHSIVWSFSCSGPNTTVRLSYNLGRGYTHFTGIVGVPDDSLSTVTADFVVTADGKDVGTYSVALGSPATVDVDVSGILRLTISGTYTMPSNCDSGHKLTVADGSLI